MNNCVMRIKLNSGDEYDALTNAKKYVKWRSGQRKKIKRAYNKRLRRLGYATAYKLCISSVAYNRN